MWSPVVILGLTVLALARTCQGQSYVAEGYFVVDDSAVQSYVREITTTETYAVKYQKALANIRKDIDYLITQVNILFSSLSLNGLNLEIRVRRLDILSGNVITTFMPGTYYIVDSTVARNSFQNWLTLQNAYLNIQYDFAMHWTGFNLYGSSGLSETSLSNIASICSASAVSVVEFLPTFRDVVSTAHAIGFILGASNDGSASTNVMAPINSPSDANRWSFSSCTASSIKEFIRTLRVNCLVSTNVVSTKPAVTYATYTGNLLNPDATCQRGLNDSRTYMCKSLPQIYNNLPPRGNAVCSQIYCRIPNTMTCTPVYTSDGMVCDNQKRCTSGQCVSDSSAPVADTNCVWGDQKTLEFPSIPFYGSCQTFLSTYGGIYCYSSPYNESCCNTCKSYYTRRVGCEYGDKSVDCVKYTKAAVCPQYKNSLCCGYCNGYVGKRSLSVAASEPKLLESTLPKKGNAIEGILDFHTRSNSVH